MAVEGLTYMTPLTITPDKALYETHTIERRLQRRHKEKVVYKCTSWVLT